MILLHKILPLLASPLFLILVLAVWGALIRSKTVNLAAVGILNCLFAARGFKPIDILL